MNEDGTAGRVYISHVMDIEDDEYFYPKSLQPELLKAVGPMCYFASFDRHTKLGDDIALESFDKINDWHMDATRYLFEANPDFVLASSNTKGNVEWLETLEAAGINVAYFEVNDLQDYLEVLKICTDITGRKDLYE